MSASTTLTPPAFNPPSMLRATLHRSATIQTRMTQGLVKVLQSNRTPTQLSLFGPAVGR